MNLNFSRADLLLGRHESIRLQDAAGTRVQTLRGELWITQDGDPKDYFLRCGDELVISDPGLVLIQAFGPAEVVLREPSPLPSTLGRLARAIGGWIAARYGPHAIMRLPSALHGAL